VLTFKNTNTTSNAETTNIRVTGIYTDDGETTYETEISQLIVDSAVPETQSFQMSQIPASGKPLRIKVYKLVGVDPLGASFVLGSTSTDLLLASYGYDAGSAVEPYPTQTVSFDGATLQPDGTKPIWVTTDVELSGNLFREGIDKLVGSYGKGGVSSGGSSSTSTDDKLQEIIDNQNRDSVMKSYIDSGSGISDATDSLTSAAVTQGDNVANALLTHAPTRGDGVATVAAASDSVVLASFSVVGPFADLSAGFKPLAFDGAFAGFSGFSAKFLAYGLVVREILLWLAIAAFWFYTRDMLETYMIAQQQTPQITTKAEAAQVHVPLIGWGKQLTSIFAIYAAFLVAIGGTIVYMNTGLGNIFTGATISSLTGLSSQVYSSVAAAAGSDILPFYERFIPLGAMVECFIAKVVISWAMPMLWAGCVSVSRAFHL